MLKYLHESNFLYSLFFLQSKSPRPRNYSFNSTCSEEQDDGSDTSSIHSDRSNSSLSTTLVSTCHSQIYKVLRSCHIMLYELTVFLLQFDNWLLISSVALFHFLYGSISYTLFYKVLGLLEHKRTL